MAVRASSIKSGQNTSACGKEISAILILPAEECHSNNLLIFETAKAREYWLILKFVSIVVHFTIFSSG